jgi:glycosyltransferase involved in cell wall biosynthesis
MKIAFIHTDLRIYWPARLKALSTYLRDKGIYLEIVEISGAGSPYAFADKAEHDGLLWHILFPDKKMEAIDNHAIKRKLYQFLNKLQPDILICGAIAFPSGALSVAWAYKNKRKVICFDDAKIETVQRSSLVNRIKQYIYNGVYAMLYPSSDWEHTGGFWGFSKEQLFYGIDVVDNSFWRSYYKCQKVSSPYFLVVGRQIPQKNLSLILYSYNKYHKKYLQASMPLIIIGDGPERPLLEEYVKNNNLSHCVSFEPFKNQSELKTFYHNAGCLILSSSSETWGLVINEAMACGLPVISSIQCGATNTLIEDGVNGFSFNIFEKDALFEKMSNYHELPQNMKTIMSRNAVKTINQWDLSLFCKNCYDAVKYVSYQPVKKLSLINSLIIRIWQGRYRPI